MFRQTARIVPIAALLMFGVGIRIAAAQMEPAKTAQEIGQAAGNFHQMIQDQIRSFAADPGSACDKLFVLNSSLNNQKEIALAQLAQQRAQSPEVRQISQRIIDDATRANDQLQRVADQLSVQLPAVNRDMPPMADSPIFQALPVDQVERHYVINTQADRASELIRCRGTAQLTQNEAVKQYARAQIPVLTAQYDQLQQVAVALGLPAVALGMPAAVTGSEPVPAAARMGPAPVYSPAPAYAPVPAARPADTDLQPRKEGGTGGTAEGANDSRR